MEKKFDNLERPKTSWWWRFDCPNFLTVALIILVLTLAIVFIKPDKPTEQAKISQAIYSAIKDTTIWSKEEEKKELETIMYAQKLCDDSLFRACCFAMYYDKKNTVKKYKIKP